MANAVIGALRVTLGLDTASFQKDIASAMKSLKSIGKGFAEVGNTMSAAVSAPIAAFGALTLKTAGDFEAGMNRVGEATGATGDEISAMRQLAVRLGADTSFSATEAADAMEMLAKNGLSAGQILGGATDASLKLASATGTDLASAADAATDVMASFGVQAKDLGTVVDQITGVTLQSKFGFADYQLALSQAGGVAGALGVSLQDFNAVLTATSSAFSSGSDAGTSFKSFLTSLNPKSKSAADAMKALGLEFYNADGSMKSMSAVAEELASKMGQLSQEELSQNMNDIFGVDGMRTAILLMKTGGKGIDELKAKIAGASAADQAAARMKGFNGQLEQLSGAFESLQIAIADSGLLKVMTDIVASLADLVASLSQANPALLRAGVVFAAVAAAAGPIAVTLGAVVAVVAALGAPITAVVVGATALAAAGAAIYASWDEIRVQFPTIATVVEGAISIVKASFDTLKQNAQALVSGIVALFTGDFAGAFQSVQQIAHNFSELWLNIAETVFPGAREAIVSGVQSIVTAMSDFGSQVVQVFAALPGQMLEIGSQIMTGLWSGIKSQWENVKAGVVGIATGIKNSVTDYFDIHSPSKLMTDIGGYIGEGLANGISGQQSNVVASATSVAGAAKTALSDIDATGQGLAKNMDSAFSSIGSGLADAIKGTKSWGDVAKSVFSSLAQSLFSTMNFGSGVGGSLLKGLFSGLTGFATGGSILPGGAGGIDSQVVAFRKSPTEQVDIYDPRKTKSSGGGGSFYSIDARGADMGAVARMEAALKKLDGSIEKRAVAASRTKQLRGTV
ncbi:phage tail tape measure protein [Allorhizobium undicola]|uniref:phage tail tape measure protein n=1 Tax=Allorhizobium undicola TaxID=78527 RepID=UPI0004898877|nr:phage tail tape measure protein [Allorhizobium undicola]